MYIEILYLLGVVLETAFSFHIPHNSQDLIVSTTSGRIHGKIDPDLPNVRQFLGIPFAQPPINDLRWAGPEPLHQPDEEIIATELPPSCMQYLSTNGDSFGKQVVLQFNLQGLNSTGDISEDCLTLSIWAPTYANPATHGWNRNWNHECEHHEQKQNLPVIIFSYGGAYQVGGQNVPYQIPAQFVSRTQNVIIISFNYRLNIFGFPNAPGLEQQNLAMLDHRAVIEWTRDNIAAFGGDPEKISLWGQSAGAAAADAYSFAWDEEPIITGMMLDSGTAVGQFPTDDLGQTNFTFVADHVGCDGLGDEPQQQLACMRGVEASVINDFIANYSDSVPDAGFDFRPVIDEKIIFGDYFERSRMGRQAKIPVIEGTNRDEGRAFAPYDPSGVNNTIATYLGLSRIICYATEASRLRQNAGLLTYRYSYAGNFSNVSPLPWLGAYHASELPSLMGTYANFRGEGDNPELQSETSKVMQDAYVAFANDPVGGVRALGWKAYEFLGQETVREFGDGVPVKDISYEETEKMCRGICQSPLGETNIRDCNLRGPW